MTDHSPPKLPLRFFRFFCSEERLEELEGDLFEVYNEFIMEKGTRFSALFYWWITLRSFRSYALKRTKMKNNRLNNPLTFLRHNLIVAWRNLRRNKTTSFINILGLAIGIGAFLAISEIIHYELSFNEEIPDCERIYRIHSDFSGAFSALNKGVPIPVGPYVEESFTGLESVAYFQTFSAEVDIPQKVGKEKSFERQEQIVICTSSIFDVFDQYKWLAGAKETALSEPYKIVLSTGQASKYFGEENWLDMLGKQVIYQDSLQLSVAGIVEEPDYNTDIEFTDFVSYATIKSSWLKDRFAMDSWGGTNSGSQLWVKLLPGKTKADLEVQLQKLDQKQLAETKDTDWVQNYKVQPLNDLHFNPSMGTFDSGRNAADLPTLSILAVVAFAILLIAIFNFINLETAQATTRSKEVGVRKVLGSPQMHLIGRFLTESMLISFFAVLISLPIEHFGFSYFEEYLPNGLFIDFTNPAMWLKVIAIAVLVGFFAGIYPSWVISSFKPISVLKPSRGSGKMSGSFLRSSLIFLQFAFSQLLIVGAIAIAWQISYMLDKELGFNEEGVVYLYTPWYESAEKQQVLENRLVQLPDVLDIALQSTPPVQHGWSTNVVKYDTPNGETHADVHRKSGDTTYLSFYNIDLLAGENLLPNDTLGQVLINETMVNEMNLKSPREAIGKVLKFNNKNHVVRGVIEDFHFQSLHNPIKPLMYLYAKKSRCIAMRINMDDQLQGKIEKISDQWNEVYPDKPAEIYFMNESIEGMYKAERKTSKLATVATIVAILISCLGLFGLISFTIVQKSKELGIRKVLGATLIQISTVLSKEFLMLIGISFLVSIPASYYFINRWMEDFTYKAQIFWWIYALGGIVSTVIAISSIAAKVWKASIVNPVESLKYE